MKPEKRKLFFRIIGLVMLSVASVLLLFAFSEEAIHRNNQLVRRYPHHPIENLTSFNLGVNSYYIAGKNADGIYLGNVSAPLHVLNLSINLKDTAAVNVYIADREKYKFSFIRIRVKENEFYVLDGTVPILFKGSTSDWIAHPYKPDIPYFILSEPAEKDNFFIKSRSASTNEDKLGKIQFSDSPTFSFNTNLLHKQMDGVFDTDGMLLSDPASKRLVYVYYYKNSFMVTNPNLELVLEGTTIDTTTTAQLKIAYLKGDKVSTLAEKPRVVNKSSSVYGHYLFIQSETLGKYEPKAMLHDAAIIDVYDVRDGSYLRSFYLYNYKDNHLREFRVYGDYLIALMGNYIVTHRLKAEYFKF